MSVIVSTKTGFPEHYYPQKALLTEAQQEWGKMRASVVKPLEQFYTNVKVEGRYLTWPLERYKEPTTFEERNNAYIETALELGEKTICTLLDQVQISPQDINQLTIVSTTGIAVPALDARLMNRIPFSRRMKRLPLFGLGCMGGAAGIARTADYLKGHPGDAVILLAIDVFVALWAPADLIIQDAMGFTAADLTELTSTNFPLPVEAELKLTDEIRIKLRPQGKTSNQYKERREYLADETGARLTGDPLALAGALEKLHGAAQALPARPEPATASLFIVNPLAGLGGRLLGLFSTHPPAEERIRRLRAMVVPGHRGGAGGASAARARSLVR